MNDLIEKYEPLNHTQVEAGHIHAKVKQIVDSIENPNELVDFVAALIAKDHDIPMESAADYCKEWAITAALSKMEAQPPPASRRLLSITYPYIKGRAATGIIWDEKFDKQYDTCVDEVIQILRDSSLQNSKKWTHRFERIRNQPASPYNLPRWPEYQRLLTSLVNEVSTKSDPKLRDSLQKIRQAMDGFQPLAD